jgi:hypothetical protein
MNININNQDVYYNKYIKYKTKYLELKESSGGDLFTKIVNFNLNLYGSEYNYLEYCLIKTKVIKEITNIMTLEDIKNKIINPPVNIVASEKCNEYCQKYNEDRRKQTLLEDFVDNNIKQIIKKSKLNKVNKSDKKDIRIIDLISVLYNIESVLFDHILPRLYVKYEGKLQEENLETKLDKQIWNNERITKRIKAEIEAQIKVQDDNIKKIKYNTNIANIIEVYNTFCNIKKDYNNYYTNLTYKNNKDSLLKSLKNIKPEVKLLIEVVILYFFFLEYYIKNNIQPFFIQYNIVNDDNTYEKKKFIIDIGSPITDIKKIFHNKVYENIFYNRNEKIQDSNTLEDLNTFYKKIKSFSFSALYETDIKNMTDELVIILTKIKNNIIFIKNNNKTEGDEIKSFNPEFLLDNVNNPFNKIIDEINKNYTNIQIIKEDYIKREIIHNETRWFHYYKTNEYLFEINYFPILLKKSINIYLYQIFNIIITLINNKK